MGQYAENRAELRAEAVEMARKAVELDRDDANAHANLGRALSSVAQIDGDFDAAFAANEYAIGINPSSAYAHYTFGRALEVAGRSEDAIRHLSTAMRLSPRDQYAGQAMAGIAGAYFDLGEFETSLEWAVKAERSNPNLTWPGLYLTRVATYVLLDRNDDARLERDALLARYPQATLAAYHSDCSGFARCGVVTEAVRKVDFPE
jgi:tetratricopeptide (TPR) repeat protein